MQKQEDQGGKSQPQQKQEDQIGKHSGLYRLSVLIQNGCQAGKTVVDSMHRHGYPNGIRFHHEKPQNQAAEKGEYDLRRVSVEKGKQKRGSEHGKPVPKPAESLQDGTPEEELFHKRGNDRDREHKQCLHQRGIVHAVAGDLSAEAQGLFQLHHPLGGEISQQADHGAEAPRPAAGEKEPTFSRAGWLAPKECAAASEGAGRDRKGQKIRELSAPHRKDPEADRDFPQRHWRRGQTAETCGTAAGTGKKGPRREVGTSPHGLPPCGEGASPAVFPLWEKGKTRRLRRVPPNRRGRRARLRRPARVRLPDSRRRDRRRGGFRRGWGKRKRFHRGASFASESKNSQTHRTRRPGVPNRQSRRTFCSALCFSGVQPPCGQAAKQRQGNSFFGRRQNWPKESALRIPRGGGKPRAGFSCIVPQGFPARKGKAKGLGKEEVFTAFFLILVLTERKKPAVFKFLENFAFILWRGESFCCIMKKPVSPEIWAEAPLFSLILLRKRNRSE